VDVGSPFQYTVGKSTAGGTHKVDFGGVGVDKGQVGLKSKSTIFRYLPNNIYCILSSSCASSSLSLLSFRSRSKTWLFQLTI